MGRLLPNPWGLHDLAGLCLQWCEDMGHDGYAGAPADGSPWLQPGADPGYRILRGGSDLKTDGRSAARYAMPERLQGVHFGYRLKASGPGLGDTHP